MAERGCAAQENTRHNTIREGYSPTFFLIIKTIAVSGTGFYTITLIQQHEEDLAFVQMVGTQESVFRRLGNAFLAKPKT